MSPAPSSPAPSSHAAITAEEQGSSPPVRASGRRTLAEDLDVLELVCKQLILRPHDETIRLVLATALMSWRLTPAHADSTLVRALINEARAHGNDLAFRLEGGGYDTIFIGATAAKFCQTLAVLKGQLRGLISSCVPRVKYQGGPSRP